MVHSLVLILILVVLMPYASLIPMSTIAAILFVVAYNMCGWREFTELLKKAPKSDIIVLLITFILTIVFDLVVAIQVGIIIAAFLFLKRMSEVANIREWYIPDDNTDDDLYPVPKGTLVFEIEGTMFFAAVDQFLRVSIDKDSKVVILRMQRVPAIDISALLKLEDARKYCVRNHITLILSHVTEQPFKAMEKAGFVDDLEIENFSDSIEEALARAEEICKSYNRRKSS